MSLRGPDYDLIPEAVFKAKTGKSFAMAGCTPLSVARPGGGAAIKGVLIYATAWNPPVGCFRVSYAEYVSARRR